MKFQLQVLALAVVSVELPAAAGIEHRPRPVTGMLQQSGGLDHRPRPVTGMLQQSGRLGLRLQIDPVTEKETEEAFEQALQDEEPGLNRMAKRQMGLTSLGSHVERLAAAVQSSNEDGDDPVSSFEKDVTSLVLGLGKGGNATASQAQSMAQAIGKIKDLIENQMLPAVKESHKVDQNELDKLYGELQACFTTRDTAVATADLQRVTYEDASGKHKTCRNTEESLYNRNIEAHEQWKEKKELKNMKCQAYALMAQQVGNEHTNKEIVSYSGGESVETYVRRVTDTICGKALKQGDSPGNGGHGQDGLLDKLLDAKDDCETATADFHMQTNKSRRLDKDYHDQVKQCNSLQDTMDGGACNFAIEKKDACEAYEGCYKAKSEAYADVESTVRKEEIDRKSEWRGLMRMHCLIAAFLDWNVTDAEITECRSAIHSTSHLDVVYPNVPTIDSCEVPDEYPTTEAYKKKQFKDLPTHAKGKEDANECTGVEEISKEPAQPSLPTCKCERVTLNGPFSPGPVVKCTGCNDIHRTTDKSSCPEGTKLFSPRSRQDWATFLASAGPLRDPNWIIDVTRPERGCGGCNEHNMNSQTAQQESWVTQDGSPWWLRSSLYQGTDDQTLSGDYHANCFLGLEQDPPDADSITFNDRNCDYHSKSYYCQLWNLDPTPKEGSPVGCTCKKVELIGHYSARELVKCEGCLDVYRSDDKNSCPKGMKIWSPRTREDWKTFIDSATRLASPNWLIDITRPQNGCGGCQTAPMNSGSPEQATWSTADGSPWWLRSQNHADFSETLETGDYEANCYLDLFSAPVSENSVAFKANKCLVHSNSYYCQTAVAKVDEEHTTTVAPWVPDGHRTHHTTKPKEGSPANCTCTQMALTGTYSAGDLLKCTGCLSVSKSTDKNSCPENTRIFAPQSRADWKVFFKSGGQPLRDPNWIIDITNGENSCGGCTGHPMNSANAEQGSWKTSDGSPWWLRSSTFEEPSGDYIANCYLDLFPDGLAVANVSHPEDNVQFRDGNCNYHSASYYCQPIDQ